MPRRTQRANSRRSRGKFRDDPPVPISGERVKAALLHSGLTLPELARQLGNKRQTLDYIVRSKTKRCRQSRRAAMARALAVSPEWLGGVGEGGMEWLLGRLAGKPRSHLAINRLGRLCEAAVERDGRPVPNATGLLLKLALPDHWRGVLFDELPHDLLGCEDLAGLERDLAKTALANVFEVILRPWLTGQATLNYKAVQRLSSSAQ